MNINTDPGCYKWGSRYRSILPLDGGCFCSFFLWVDLVAPAVMWRREGQFLNILNYIFFFPCLGSFSEWPPKLDSVKRQQCKLCSVEGRKKESEVAQLYPTLCHSLDCSLPVSSIHGIFQARILEWITISFSRGYSQWEHRLLRLADLVKMYFVCQFLSATPDICVNIVSCMSGSVWISTYPHII